MLDAYARYGGLAAPRGVELAATVADTSVFGHGTQ
jgi:hypothetical protein